KTINSTEFALLGAALVAISYGLARFAFGLFVPPIRAELALTPETIGIIGALPLLSFVLATLVAPFITERLGARTTIMLSGGFAVCGLLLISLARGAWSLGLAVIACGICTGLMMPALTAAMQQLVNRAVHGRVSAVMNAGTSFGVMLAAPAIVLLTSAWRMAYLCFALLAAVAVIITWWRIPAISRPQVKAGSQSAKLSKLPWWPLIRLSLFALAMGFVSSAYWIFAPDLVVSLGTLPAGETGWLWLAVGLAGLSGAAVADLADRIHSGVTHALMFTLLAVSLALLVAGSGQLLASIVSALIFGLAYMSLTGLYLMTAVRLLPGRLSMGPVLPFMACALGQAAGSPVIGSLVTSAGYKTAFISYTVLALLVTGLSSFYPQDTKG
ncbi:MFS transporter, partial [Arsukibacterium sp.]|uniref:MFS transporter n=1 Tax=Arsukibacterium sp. TaxID=1977258 RepID=UPI00299D657F